MRIKRNLITGGARYLGAHLTDRLMEAGEEVICRGNYSQEEKATFRSGWAIQTLS